MALNIKKAVISTVVIYALIFLTASALLFAITDATIFGAVTVLIATILAIVVTKEYYFKGMRIKKPVREGLMVGIVMVLVMLAIEIPLMVYGFAAEQGWTYLTSWNIMLGYLSLLLVPILVAYEE